MDEKRPRVLTIKRAAHALALSERTLWRLIKNDKIRVIALSERRRGISVEEIERVAAGGCA